MKNKSKVTADLKKNRLLVILHGRLSKSDMQEIYTEIRFGVADLAPGFSVITDLTQCRIGYLTGLETFMKISEYLQQKGVGIAIRIAAQNQLVFRQISQITTKKENYPILYVNSQQEAEAAIASASGGPTPPVS